ncbi:MAG TPA: cryptochrome/photolyase family protein [Aquabacterium sp.]|uniref:cryptochrome/photolyase family protein n=1 Tax=Aquabacterium sp. TaxID=1872578 RepID=UPI002E345B98|nr:cryptochrome/photolyase family protein [Aquabacterium sp.]HEX5356463.1 cryptochrome/photolyase family protein [Aquabacterium sp.]
MPAAADPTLRLILGDQLNSLHSWFDEVRDDVVYVLMEVRQETDYVRHHAQKILAILAAMRDFSRQLRETGHRVRYVPIDSPSNRQSITDNLDALITHYGAKIVQYQAPDEWRLDAQLAAWRQACMERGVHCEMVCSQHFYTQRDEAARLFGDRRGWLMEHFYRHMRRLHGVLMATPQKPAGGQWNFDHDNRQAWHGTPPAPLDWRRQHDHSALWHTIVACGVPSFGNPQASQLAWPLNRAEALQHLDAFIQRALPHFGQFQDAISQHNWRLFHSLLSFALNVKMLGPREVVMRAQEAWQAGHAPLAAAEGFIRQILGWREYVRGVYWHHMPGYVQHNKLAHELPLPEWFWTGDTRMACMAQAIGQSLEQAYAHHIQRLMVIGNFALLAGLDPQAVHRWYLGVYIDAFEWVELPNTLGMSQFADGGLMATKPYVSSAAYLDRMGDHCAGCHYRKKDRLGERACPYNALYWDFHIRHADRLRRNPRIGMVYKQIDRMPPADIDAIQSRSQDIKARLDRL